MSVQAWSARSAMTCRARMGQRSLYDQADAGALQQQPSGAEHPARDEQYSAFAAALLGFAAPTAEMTRRSGECPFLAVGAHYAEFGQLADADVISLLEGRHRRMARSGDRPSG
jgi:hypothetical protein